MSIEPNISMYVPPESAEHIESEDMKKVIVLSSEGINEAIRQGHTYIRIMVTYASGKVHQRLQVRTGFSYDPPSETWEDFIPEEVAS